MNEIKLYKLYFATVCGLILISCNNHQEYDSNEEINVLNDVFVELMGTDNYYMPLPAPPYPYSLELCENNEDSMKYLRWENEISTLMVNPKEDSLDLVIAFSDTLISPDNYEHEGILNRIKHIQSYLPDSIDGSVILPMLNFLIDSTKYELQDGLIGKITDTGRYKLRELNQLRKEYPRYKNMVSFRFIGDLRLSRVIFNEERTHAVFYQEYICGAECGAGDLIWVKKQQEQWTIVWRINLWVS
ncbi:hypothetical protein [Carboxylicivirga linearis]|uniref:DUF4829 domain-containing protein n=1 Tax=Carboxylicivirga linearis TaxID=1628157 RepID=A0ABS5K0X4_9BACT|nr:hypothetical protein [Carboxylicivirga linearis]MBS2100830.1 hypothetical protein [Carboxylicivirga linearis]